MPRVHNRCVLWICCTPLPLVPARCTCAAGKRQEANCGTARQHDHHRVLLGSRTKSTFAPADAVRLAMGLAPSPLRSFAPATAEASPTYLREHVLDLGAGIGVHAIPVARVLAHGTLAAVDVQQQMTDELDRRARRLGIATIETRAVDARRLPFSDHIFDAAYWYLCSVKLPIARPHLPSFDEFSKELGGSSWARRSSIPTSSRNETSGRWPDRPDSRLSGLSDPNCLT